MKKAINCRAFSPEMSIRKCLELAKKAGFVGLEINMDEAGEITLNSTKKQMEEIAKSARELGVELTSLCTKEFFFRYSLTDNDSNMRKRAKKGARKMLELASYVGIDTVLIVPGSVDAPAHYSLSPVSYDTAYQRSLESLKELLPTAEKYEVNMSIETILWNKFLLSPLEMRDFADKLGSKFISIYFDTGNVRPFGYPEHWIRILGQRIRRVHIKEFKEGTGHNPFLSCGGLLEGDVNWPEVMEALEEVGYDGYLIAEPLVPLARYPDYLIYQTSAAMDRILSR